MDATCPMAIKGDESRLDPVIKNDPFPFYEALRQQYPVYYDPKLDVFLVTKYEDAKTVLGDPETYSLEHGYQDRYANGHLEEFAEIMNREGGGFIRDLGVDPPAHTRLRKLTEQAFTAHRVKTLEEDFRKIVVDLIEPLAARGYGDGMKDIGGPLTAQVICEQLGFDFAETGAVKIARWSNAVIAQIGRMQTREEMLVNAREFVELQQYIIKNIREREVAPRDDMITDLINAHLEGEENPKLSFEEKVASIRAFLIAGNDTTAAAIGNMLLVLATQEGLLEDLYEKVDDNRVMNRFVEEILRIHPPVHGLYRTAMKDVVLGGTSIPALSQICIMFASANSDDEKFSCPRELDLDRPNAAAHLAFGSGIHRCIGASLSRMEIKVAAQEVIRRLTDIRLTIPRDKLTYLPTLATHTMEYLPLTFKRRGA